jgi:phosphoglycolate phosphatase
VIGTVIIDLDGPILDGKFRHYACYKDILLSHGCKPLEIEEYWSLKREHVDLSTLLAASQANSFREAFNEQWLELIEQPHFLALDRLQPGSKEVLQQWRVTGLRLILATMRHDPLSLSVQLDSLDLVGLFTHVVACPSELGGVGKALRVKASAGPLSTKESIWIGDSEADIEAARTIGLRVIAVTCGIRSEEYLVRLRPDILAGDLTSVDLSSFL